MALLWILMVRPVGWSDLTFQEDQLSGFDGRAVTECPGVIVLIVASMLVCGSSRT